MRSNYKKLGSYIREVVVKNTDLFVDKLLGVSITKQFIPSIANTLGTDMSRYKIVRTNQFAYGPVTSRNGDKISVALLQESNCIVSTSYTTFEIIDTEALDPEYLMMWFRRPEFDRYARFKSHGSVRELFDWGEMCDVELPIPHIDKQREIVCEYNTIVARIKFNKNLNQKLEETAQALYKQWFVDFEFPISKEYAESIGRPELIGEPFKTSGGEMMYSKDLEQEYPSIWSQKSITEICEVINGRAYKNGEYRNSGTQIIRIQNLNGGKKWIYSDMNLPEKKYVSNGALIFAWSATFGPFIWRGEKSIYHYHIWRLDCHETKAKLFLFNHLKRVTAEVSGQGSGSIFAHITKSLMEAQLLIYPNKYYLKLFDKFASKIDKKIEQHMKDTELSGELISVLESKMSSGAF